MNLRKIFERELLFDFWLTFLFPSILQKMLLIENISKFLRPALAALRFNGLKSPLNRWRVSGSPLVNLFVQYINFGFFCHHIYATLWQIRDMYLVEETVVHNEKPPPNHTVSTGYKLQKGARIVLPGLR